MKKPDAVKPDAVKPDAMKPDAMKRFQRPTREGLNGNDNTPRRDQGPKGSNDSSSFARRDQGSNDRPSFARRDQGPNDRSSFASRAPGPKKAPEVPPADAFPVLGTPVKAAKAPVWVAGQNTSQVIARALQVKTPPPAAPVLATGSGGDWRLEENTEDEEDIPTFEEYTSYCWGDE
jgi:hypothetical protein